MSDLTTFYQIILTLKNYWNDKNCTILQPLDIPVGAGTFHHQTFFGVLNSQPTSFGYVQACRRPSDGRYGENPNRLQHYYQFQVIIKPAPDNIQNLYLESLEQLNIDLKSNDIRFMEDNWENPTLGASGKGWEVRINGMEITQFTYFQQMGGLNCTPISVEITYGLERMALHIQNKNNIYDLNWDTNRKKNTYKDLFLKNELENSIFNFEYSNIKVCFNLFNIHMKEAQNIINFSSPLLIPAYEQALYGIHYFNLLDAKKTFSTTERQQHILNIRTIIKNIAKKYHTLNKH
ncbi:MAG: glycine--tRNA ligase subunit alpha [Buchnera aphidicola (Nurudea shiraii)]